MADPLSIIASVAGIISLADVVFARIYKYAKAAGSAQKDVRDLAEEVKTVRDLLCALSSLVSRLDAAPVITTFNLSYVKSCQETLQQIEDGLSKAQTDFEKSKLRRIQRKLKWPFTATETRDPLKNLARQKGNIGLSLGTDCVSLILSGLPRLKQLETSVTQISNDIQNMSVGVHNILSHARLVDPYFKRVVIGSFTEVNPQARLNRNLAQVVAGTYRRTFDIPVFRDWLNKPGSKLGITGISGTGKTMLAGCLVQEALRRQTIGVGVAYFYCDFKDARTQSLLQILGTLAAQLADQNNEAYECLQRYYKRLHPLEANAIARTPTVINLVSILQEMTECFERVSIIIDGLDECGDECGVVADVLASAGNASNISMALLSRNEYRIFQHFGDADRWELESNSDDIRTYLEDETETGLQSQQVPVVNPQVKEEIVQEPVRGADGTFVQ
ncbi:hypothetical protein B0T10DRAFT_325065 [Thelonectria olida]|uniref:Nephrocystin 3-like N-terminal domain-containing protein n=1 Tax=Thelonectria olida TaxID=1576542 RepID=A0A9P8W6U9_9HYPO|nr:hypothetical protein B0T10DRAFT_325065 [Thelonectria olida]